MGFRCRHRSGIRPLLVELLDVVMLINRKQSYIMADIAALQAAADQISTDVGEAIVALDDLAAKVAAGETVSQADIDAITAKLTEASTNLDDAVATDDPPV